MPVTRTAGLLAPAVAAVLVASCAGSASPPGALTSSTTPPVASRTSTPPTSSPQSTPSDSTSASASVTPDGPSTTATTCAKQTLTGLSRAERIGQLVMVGMNAATDPTSTAKTVSTYHLGAVTFIGRSYAGVTAMKRTTTALRRAADLPLLISTDQEGGQVQVLHGPGFPEMPTALAQGRIAPATLQADATTWGRALRKAGLSANLAPVLDVVPASLGTANQPIGRYYREYGHTAARVSSHGLAFAHGMQQARIVPVVKHFPGLGSVRGNTDVTSHVVDTVTSADSASLRPFRNAVRAGLPMVMVSSAYYTHLDPNRPAMFSKKVITGLLRNDLGFHGVVITDDMADAAAAKAYGSLARRSVDFIAAGGDVLLSVNAAKVPAIVSALANRARSHPAFARRINAAALRVLQLKTATGLLSCSG